MYNQNRLLDDDLDNCRLAAEKARQIARNTDTILKNYLVRQIQASKKEDQCFRLSIAWDRVTYKSATKRGREFAHLVSICYLARYCELERAYLMERGILFDTPKNPGTSSC